MHAYLITGGSEDDRQKKIQEYISGWHGSPIDCTLLTVKEDKEEIGIAQVRAFIHELSLSPRSSPYHIGIISHAHTLTRDAANALLKTLEEPPSKVKILLESEKPDTLLLTILSRVTTLRLKDNTETPQNTVSIKMLESALDKSPGAIIDIVDTTILSKTDATQFFSDILPFFHTQLIRSLQPNTGRIIRAVLEALKKLSANVNYRLVTDDFFFFYTRQALANPVK